MRIFEYWLECILLVAFVAAIVFLHNRTEHEDVVDVTTEPERSMASKIVSDPWLHEYKYWTKIFENKDSTLHWNQKITLFMKGDVDIYRHNHKVELLESSGADEMDIEEAGGFKLYPVGTEFMKENYKTDRKGKQVLDSYTYMKKTSESEWHYMQVSNKHRLMVDSNKPQTDAHTKCIACHEPVAHRDYIFHTYDVLDDE